MATLREIRRRIGGVKSTQKITKAMKMVAAAKLRRAQDSVFAARPYSRKMKELLQNLAAKVDVSASPLFTSLPVDSVALIVVTSDRGLCGAFNSNIIRAATAHVSANYSSLASNGKLSILAVGRKGGDFFQKNDYKVAAKHLGVFTPLVFENAQKIAREAIAMFLSGKVQKIELVYNEFKSIIQQRVVIEQFLPIPPIKPNAEPAGRITPIDYIYEPSSEAIISALAPLHLNFQIWRALLESNAAEQGARMSAMDNATTNASDLIRDLQLSYNKARQASITKELLEIVSGAEALKAAG